MHESIADMSHSSHQNSRSDLVTRSLLSGEHSFFSSHKSLLCVCVYIHVYMRICVHMCTSGVDLECLSHDSKFYAFNGTWTNCWNFVSSKDPPLSAAPVLRLQASVIIPGFLWGCEGLNSGWHACAGSVFMTEQPP